MESQGIGGWGVWMQNSVSFVPSHPPVTVSTTRLPRRSSRQKCSFPFHLHNSHARYSIRHPSYSHNARLIPAIILRLHYLSPATLPAHRNLAASYATVCAQLQLGYGIFAATVPCLKPLVAVWEECGRDSHGDHGKRVGGQRARVPVEQEGEEMN